MFTFHRNEVVQTEQKATANKSLFLSEVEECNVLVTQWIKNSLQCGRHRNADLILGLGKSPGGEHDNPLQNSCLGNPMDRGAWRTAVHRVAKSRTQLRQLSRAQL